LPGGFVPFLPGNNHREHLKGNNNVKKNYRL
jgi:hypothetical protein